MQQTITCMCHSDSSARKGRKPNVAAGVVPGGDHTWQCISRARRAGQTQTRNIPAPGAELLAGELDRPSSRNAISLPFNASLAYCLPRQKMKTLKGLPQKPLPHSGDERPCGLTSTFMLSLCAVNVCRKYYLG